MTITTLVFRIAETSVPGVFQLELERLAKCGVRTKYEKETIWVENFFLLLCVPNVGFKSGVKEI